MTITDPRALLADLYWQAVQAVAPGPALRSALEDQAELPRARLHLLALGKAAGPMAEAAVAFLGSIGRSPAGGILVVPEPTPSPHPSLPVVVGDHPLPAGGSFTASARLGEAVREVRAGDEVWVLLSGGASSLIAAPVPGINPSDLSSLYRLLLGSGLDIGAMNQVRKRFSRWAAGRLGMELGAALVKNFTISDVINDDLASIGSGPCVGDPATAGDLIDSLTRKRLWERLPLALRDHLVATRRGLTPETPKPGDALLTRISTRIIASNRLAVDAACHRARALGLAATTVDAALAGEAADAGRAIASRLLTYHASPEPMAQGSGLHAPALLVWGGETTVTLPADAGLGGRNQELVLAAAERLRNYRGCLLLSAGTDGRDGPTDAAGAFADGGTWDRVLLAGRDPGADLIRHDSHAALEAAGDLFRTGLTGTNVMDLVLGLVTGQA